MGLLRNTAAAGLMFVALPAGAQTLANGEPLRFNYEYHCNGERMVVGHCRDNDPNSYCLVYYPDRTSLHPPIEVQKAEQLGQVLAKLSACAETERAEGVARLKAALGATERASSSSAETDVSRTTKVPGLGSKAWQVLGVDDNSVTFFSPADFRHSAEAGGGWFTRVYFEPRDFRSVAGVRFVQLRFAADCVNETVTTTGSVLYYSDGRMIVASGARTPARHAAAGSEDAALWNVLCDRPQRLPQSEPVKGNGAALLAYAARVREPSVTAARPVAAQSSPTTARVPGLGKQSWQLLFINDDLAIFYTKAGVKLSGRPPEGWFTEVFTDEENLGSGVSGAEFFQTHYEGDCTSNAIRLVQFAAYDIHKKLLKAGSLSDAEFHQAKPNSDQSQILALLCGAKKMATTDPFVGDGILLFGLYVELQKAREKK